MGLSGRSRHYVALSSLLLLAHTAVAARLMITPSKQQQLGDFDVFTSIQSEVDKMNTNLEELSKAIADMPAPSPPSPTDEPTSPTDGPTGEPPSPSEEPKYYLDELVKVDDKLRRLAISRNFLTLEVERKAADNCDDLQDIDKTVDDAQGALDLVSDKQLSNSTLQDLEDSNTKLSATTTCVNNKKIILSSDDKDTVQKSITATQESGKTAAETINNIINPPTPEPEDDSGFRAATITLGVLFALSLIAVAVLAIMMRKRS